MMRKILLVLILLFFSVPVMAGAGHDHSHGHGHSHAKKVSRHFVVREAKRKVKSLVRRGKIEKSWNPAQVPTIVKRRYRHGHEWVVIFTNDKAADKSKQTLYLFYTLKGDYLAANFTGK